MLRNYFDIAQADPGNSRIDLAPINNALSNIRQNQYQNALMERRDAETAYQQGRDQKQDARQAESDKWARAERAGKIADAVEQLQGPQRQAAWQRVLTQFGSDDMTPEEMDPMTGPALLRAQAGMYRDPMDQKLKEADLAYKQAQTSKAYADAKNDGSDFGKTGTIVRGADGNLYSVRYRADGTEQINPLQVGGQTVQQDRGTDVVGDVIVDKSTGQEVRNVGDAIAGGERAKIVGRETGEREMAAPKARSAMEAFDAKSDIVIKTADEAEKMIGSLTAGFPGAVLSKIPGTAARNLSAKLDTLKANAGFQELQAMRDNSPTGGALGQVAVQELAMLQATITSLEQAQTPEQLAKALQDYRTFVRESKIRRKTAYDLTYGSSQQPQTQAQPQGLQPGAVEDGYRYKGGNPADQNSWEKVN